MRHQRTDKGKATHLRSVKQYARTHPEVMSAHGAVAQAKKTGDLALANTLQCSSCGEPAKEYHHYLGYGREHWLDVTPVCKPCHVKAGQ